MLLKTYPLNLRLLPLQPFNFSPLFMNRCTVLVGIPSLSLTARIPKNVVEFPLLSVTSIGYTDS